MKLKVSDNNSFKKLTILFCSEFVATAMLVSLICASNVNSNFFPRNQLTAAFSCGFSVATCAHCFGCVSGSHINPAVSIANFVLGNISLVTMCVYIVGQFSGGILGYAIFMGMVPEEGMGDTVCLTLIHPTCSTLRGFFIEFILTAFLIYFLCGSKDSRNAKFGDSAAIKAGSLIMMLIIAGGKFTGASVNPARSFAPALFHMNFDRFWVYLLSQILAAILVPLTWIFIFASKSEKKEEPTAEA